MLLIKQFAGDLVKLKGFLIQIKFRIYQEGIKLAILTDKVAFVGMFLVGDLLRWVKPYFADIQKNGIVITNLKTQYIFVIQEGFKEQITQIYRNPEEEATAERKLQALV